LTAHVAVVDPGVGSDRAAIAVRTADYFFVGPDNGVLSLALAGETVLEIRRIENAALLRQPLSRTFHGRDVFAPVAARLVQGALLDSLGGTLNDYVRLDLAEARFIGGVWRGEIVYVDRFGNCITNITAPAKSTGRARVAGRIEVHLRQFYQQGAPGEPIAVVGSTGLLEIAINGGNAAQSLGLKIGDVVEVR
jgi:S-adenosylmethionine hydrolase